VVGDPVEEAVGQVDLRHARPARAEPALQVVLERAPDPEQLRVALRVLVDVLEAAVGQLVEGPEGDRCVVVGLRARQLGAARGLVAQPGHDAVAEAASRLGQCGHIEQVSGRVGDHDHPKR
jgi:hypothetical protein